MFGQLTSFYQNKFLKEKNVNVEKYSNLQKEKKSMGTFSKSLNKYEIYKVKIRKKKISPQQYFRLESGFLEWWGENSGINPLLHNRISVKLSFLEL